MLATVATYWRKIPCKQGGLERTGYFYIVSLLRIVGIFQRQPFAHMLLFYRQKLLITQGCTLEQGVL